MKRLLFALVIPCLGFAANEINSSSDAEDTDTTSAADEEGQRLLDRYIGSTLRKFGVTTNWSISGDLETSVVSTTQKLKDAIEDNPIFAVYGEVCLRYRNADALENVIFTLESCNKVKTGNIKGGAAINDTAFAAIEGKYGKIKGGYTNSAGDEFSISYSEALTGFAGANNNFGFSTYYAQTSGCAIATGFERDDNKALKIAYISPVLAGWSFGVSYSPNSRDAHLFKEDRNKTPKDISPAQNFADDTAYSRHNISGGIAYEYGAPDAFNLKVAVAGWYGQGKSDITEVHNVKGYNVGAVLGYQNYKLALGFTDNGKSLLGKKVVDENHYDGYRSGANCGKLYNAAIAYIGEKWEIALGYFHATRKFSDNEKTRTRITTASVQYNCTDVISVYFEWDNLNTKTCDRSMKTESMAEEGILGSSKVFGNNHANMWIGGLKMRI